MRSGISRYPRRIAFALIAALGLPVASSAQQAPAQASEGTVLFVCEHGTVKSLLAKLLFEKYAAEVGLLMRAESRGTAVDSAVPAWMQANLAKSHLLMGTFQPLALSPSDLSAASFVVSFDLPVAATADARAPRAHWDSLPPASREFVASHDAIQVRVRALVDSLHRARRARRP